MSAKAARGAWSVALTGIPWDGNNQLEFKDERRAEKGRIL